MLWLRMDGWMQYLYLFLFLYLVKRDVALWLLNATFCSTVCLRQSARSTVDFQSLFLPHKMLDSDQANKLNSGMHFLFGCFSIFVGVSPWWGSKNILQLKSESLSQSYNTHLLLRELPSAVFLFKFLFIYFLSSVVFIFFPILPSTTNASSFTMNPCCYLASHLFSSLSNAAQINSPLISLLGCHHAES